MFQCEKCGKPVAIADHTILIAYEGQTHCMMCRRASGYRPTSQAEARALHFEEILAEAALTLQVRFNWMIGRNSKPVLTYCLATPFTSATFVSETGAPYDSVQKIIEALDSVGLPGHEISQNTAKEYTVTLSQLRDLGLKPPA